MEGDSTADEARAALDRIAEERSRKCDALAYVSGALKYHCDKGDNMSPETVKRVFNDALDDAGVEGLRLE